MEYPFVRYHRGGISSKNISLRYHWDKIFSRGTTTSTLTCTMRLPSWMVSLTPRWWKSTPTSRRPSSRRWRTPGRWSTGEKFAYHASTQWRSYNKRRSAFSVYGRNCLLPWQDETADGSSRYKQPTNCRNPKPIWFVCSCTKFDIWDRVRFLSQFSDIFVLILWQRHFKMLNLLGSEAPLWEAARLCPKQACCSIPRQGG